MWVSGSRGHNTKPAEGTENNWDATMPSTQNSRKEKTPVKMS